MAELDLGNLESYLMISSDGAPFIPLGKHPEEIKQEIESKRKIRKQIKKSVRSIWGTLGMANNKDLPVSGLLQYSLQGNTEEGTEGTGKITIDEIMYFKKGRPDYQNNEKNGRIRERYISFEDVKFYSYPQTIRDWQQIPKLRLTLFLEPGEGALVYFEIKRRGRNDLNEIEYIQPLPTPNHDCSERDRLTYEIPIFPPNKMLESGDRRLVFKQSDEKQPSKMLLKILTGRRENSQSDSILKKLYYHVFGRTHQLLRWDNNLSKFQIEDKSLFNSRYDKPVLLFIHGTLSSTNQAFTGLIKGGHNSWVANMDRQRIYDSIIAFEYPSFSLGPDENALELLERLPIAYRAPANIITHSLGTLVGKYLSSSVPNITVNRGAMVAGANGVGYFSAGWKVTKFLSILKKMNPGAPSAFISGIAQHSAEWFLKQPGCQAMTHKNDALTSILNAGRPVNRQHLSRFLPIVGDYTSGLAKGYWNKKKSNALDWVIKLMLGKKHDWVVGSKEQAILKPGLHSRAYKNHKGIIYSARHSDYFNMPKIQKLLFDFLNHVPKY